uniref:Uncharacterized protein n=1 Tax=viral metagenome TaxID=1070528 RepID=A0A6C0IEE8_9ZZZZ
MGFFFSKPVSLPPLPSLPPIPIVTNSADVKTLTDTFLKEYPEIMTAYNNLSAQKHLSDSQRIEIQGKYVMELNKVPVPTLNQFYTFMISLIKQYNIKVEPTDTQIQDLMQKFLTKYPGMAPYMENIQGLTDAQQSEANGQIEIFMNSYPLGTEDDMYKIVIDVFKKYNLPVPTLTQAQTETTTSASNNITNFKDYGKISMKMEPFINKRCLIEKEYSSFFR